MTTCSLTRTCALIPTWGRYVSGPDADATFVGETTDKQTLPDQGYHLSVPGVLERHVVFPPAGPLSGARAALGAFLRL